MRIPFEGVKKDAHQRLADIELTLPICMQKLQISGNLRRFFATPIAAHVDVEPCRALTLKLIEDIHQWAREFPNLTNIAKDPQDVINSANRSAKGLDIANDNAQSPPLPDTFVALIASNYVATKLALFGLMHKMATQSVTPPQSPEATATDWFAEAALCAKAILRGAENVENAQTPGFDLLRSIGPLVSVVCIGPGEEQFRAAGVILQRWTTKIGGLGSILQNHILV